MSTRYGHEAEDGAGRKRNQPKSQPLIEEEFEALRRVEGGVVRWVGVPVVLKDETPGFLRLSVESRTLEFRSDDGDFTLRQVVCEGETFSKPVLHIEEKIFDVACEYDLIPGRKMVLTPDHQPPTRFQQMVADAFSENADYLCRRLADLRELGKI